MSPARRLQITLILRQPLQTVGAWMDSAVVSVGLGTTAGSVRKRLAGDALVPSRLYVADGEGHLFGWIAMAIVLSSAGDTPMSGLYSPGGPSLRASMGLDAATSDPGWQEHDELPVVDHAGVLIGAIRYAALRGAIFQAAEEAAPSRDTTGLSALMTVSNLCYLAMAEAIDASLGRRRFNTPTRREDAS